MDKNLLLQSVPVQYRDRPAGSYSKLNTYTDGFKVIMTIFRLCKNYKPFAFWGIISLVLAIISFSVFVPVLFEYFVTGLVPRIPTLIVSAFTMLAALLLFACGIILDTENMKSKQNFELQMNLMEMLKNR